MVTAAVCAVVAGYRSYAAIAEWVADVPAATALALGMTGEYIDVTRYWGAFLFSAGAAGGLVPYAGGHPSTLTVPLTSSCQVCRPQMTTT
ncbi:hypothetical protein [Micromonospora sp. NPDC005171]|uniref:hypothetical protein n=1 Tax=Micromonospora sp. NPDC005171 TaxID=3156866 RepID=UPI0033A987F1